MDDAGENLDGLAAHDWAGQAGTRWLAQLDRFESMIEPIGKALLAQAAHSPSAHHASAARCGSRR